MQPEFSPTPRGGEQAPQNAESHYEIPPNYASPEIMPQQAERSFEQSPIEIAPVAPPQPLPVQALPQVNTVPEPVQSSTIVSSSNPMSASDDDVIEKEWVDRAKQIITQTKSDPYARERAISELQKDYLMKRYGKQLGSTTD